MPRLIDADKLLAEIKTLPIMSNWGESFFPQLVQGQPTIDAVEVVRCKDCVYWDDDPDTYGANYGPKGKCMKSFETMYADDFCSCGERRDT